MKSDIYKAKKILITGASSGIGLEFGRILCEYECTLILVALKFESLQKIQDELSGKGKAKIFCFKFNLGSIEDIKNLCRALRDKELLPDILINNAGRQSYGYFYKLNMETEHEEIILNCVAPVYLIHEFVPRMIANNFGKILNVGSAAGTMPGPFFATYSASKSFLNSFSQAMSEELRDKNVQCACLLPGKTNCKNFWSLPGLEGKVDVISGFAPPKEVARYGLRLIERNMDYGVYGFRNNMIQFIRKFAPRRALAWALRRHSYSKSLEEE